MLTSAAQWLFDPAGLTPHGFCLLWDPGLIWIHALSDVAIAAAYFTIPAAIVFVARHRKELIFRPVFWLFATFITLCGTEHLLEVLTLWVPAYGLQGTVKIATAVVSAVTAVALWKLMPQALALPVPAQLRDASNALRDSEARYRASFDRSLVPVYMLDGEGRLTAVSESWLTLLGLGLDEVVGRNIQDFSPGSWVAADIERLKADGEIREVERQFVRKDGTVIEALVSKRLERPGNTEWVSCVLIDITARRRAEKALRTSEERLHQAQKMDAVGQLTGGIAHDVNNMLQGIAGGLDLMERRISQGRSDEAMRFVEMARHSVGRASALTHRMLAFARRQALQPTTVDPAALVTGMADMVCRLIGPAVRLELPLGGDWKARCDPNQLESAILNLAINARDAMPDGGTLTIATSNRPMAAGDLQDTEPGDYIEIAVSDTGTGMSDDVLGRAFEPFFTTKPIGQGTGLGLSQLYGFVRQSEGTVQLESRVGHGTTIRIFLPRALNAVAPPAPVPAGVAQDRSVRGTVLLVEDEEKVRLVIAEALCDLGCTVLVAEDGPSGLAIVQARRDLDLLLTDVGLPGLNGRQLADAARALHPGLPILLLTGYAGSALEDMALAPGMEVLRKPFALDAMTARVSELMDRVMAD